MLCLRPSLLFNPIDIMDYRINDNSLCSIYMEQIQLLTKELKELKRLNLELESEIETLRAMARETY